MKDACVVYACRCGLPGTKPYKEEMQTVFD